MKKYLPMVAVTVVTMAIVFRVAQARQVVTGQ